VGKGLKQESKGEKGKKKGFKKKVLPRFKIPYEEAKARGISVSCQEGEENRVEKGRAAINKKGKSKRKKKNLERVRRRKKTMEKKKSPL